MANDVVIIDGVLSPEKADLLMFYASAMKSIKEKEETLRAAILAAMEANNIKSIKTDNYSITYVPESDRETFDKKAFKKDHADLYDEYVKISTVKASIRVEVSKEVEVGLK